MVQDNHSRSRHGIVRGMHFQVGDGVAKLVRCGRGRIYDVRRRPAARTRRPTADWEGFELSDENMHVLYCPIGFAHGFCVLSEVADVIYKQSSYYAAELERGISYRRPRRRDRVAAGARGRCPPSERDADAPRLAEVAAELPFEYVELAASEDG